MLAKLLRIFFRLLYNQFAWTYDCVAWTVSLGRWNDWVLSILEYINRDGLVLELGHGPGHLQKELTILGYQIFGLDKSRQMGSLAALRLKKIDARPNLVRAQAEYLPFPSNKFNHIVATFPTEYITDPGTLMEIGRTLNKGGSLVSLQVVWITGEKWYEKLAAWLFYVTGQAPDPKHIDLEQDLARPFRNAGFHTQIEKKQVGNSEVLILIAKNSIT